MSPRKTMALFAVLCVAAVTQLPAQQIADSARVAPVPASTVQESAPSTALPGPRLAPRFERVEPTVARRDASPRDLALAPQSGGSHTIVISTLGLVLVLLVILLVL